MYFKGSNRDLDLLVHSSNALNSPDQAGPHGSLHLLPPRLCLIRMPDEKAEVECHPVAWDAGVPRGMCPVHVHNLHSVFRLAEQSLKGLVPLASCELTSPGHLVQHHLYALVGILQEIVMPPKARVFSSSRWIHGYLCLQAPSLIGAP